MKDEEAFGRWTLLWCTMIVPPWASLWTIYFDLQSKNLSNRKALVALSSALAPAAGDLVDLGPDPAALGPFFAEAVSCTQDLSPSSSLGVERRSGSLCEILLSPSCAHKVFLTTGCDPELLVSSRRLPEVTAGSGLDQDGVEEGCIVSTAGDCSLIKPKYMQPQAGAKRDPSLLSNGPATGD